MRERGVWPSDCDFCGTKNVLCRLVQKTIATCGAVLLTALAPCPYTAR